MRLFQRSQINSFPPDFPSVDVAKGLASSLLSNPKFYSIVAEDNTSNGGEDKNSIVGSNFLDERSNIVAGVRPLTIDPKYQNKGTGRQLMINALERAKKRTSQQYVYSKLLITVGH